LFGHAKGSFTGASAERIGLWEQADGGTIFLDEITETNPLFQVKLLRALQQGEVRRVGSNKTLRVDVRVIAATNRDIEDEVAAGRFRQDLMYRLNAVTISLPPLRERRDDIGLLAAHFASLIRDRERPVKFSAAALDVLRKYQWPGNVRELENAVLHAVSISDDIVYPEHLPERIRIAADGGPSARVSESNGPHPPENGFVTLAEMQADYVRRVLESTEGNKQAAARILNIDRKTLSRMIARSDEA
jgi:transcriptional regulator with GAF, ATPase, and Fis domain